MQEGYAFEKGMMARRSLKRLAKFDVSVSKSTKPEDRGTESNRVEFNLFQLWWHIYIYIYIYIYIFYYIYRYIHNI